MGAEFEEGVVALGDLLERFFYKGSNLICVGRFVKHIDLQHLVDGKESEGLGSEAGVEISVERCSRGLALFEDVNSKLDL